MTNDSCKYDRLIGLGPGSLSPGSTPVMAVLLVLADMMLFTSIVQPALGLLTNVVHYVS